MTIARGTAQTEPDRAHRWRPHCVVGPTVGVGSPIDVDDIKALLRVRRAKRPLFMCEVASKSTVPFEFNEILVLSGAIAPPTPNKRSNQNHLLPSDLLVCRYLPVGRASLEHLQTNHILVVLSPRVYSAFSIRWLSPTEQPAPASSGACPAH
jgi:hypothetical protein